MADAARSASRRVATRLARLSYGRLLSILAARDGDIAAAEDGLAGAFEKALARWPETGVPDAPEAWLLTVARRLRTDMARRRDTHVAAIPALQMLMDVPMDGLDRDMPDPRLGLMFVCAHPAIDARVRTPLMLQTVLGLDAARIARVFLISPAAMAQRLVRAKAKIKAAGIPFGVPDRSAWAPRLGAVLEAIYAAFTADWSVVDDIGNGLTQEAEWLARLLVELVPDNGEAKGLLALILFCQSRRGARDRAGTYIPLREQDTTLWDADLMHEASALMRAAARAEDGGRFQIEAAIQSVHALRASSGETDWDMLLKLYDALLAIAPTLGGQVARAAVLGEAVSAQAGLDALGAIPTDRVGEYAPYWATYGHLLDAAGEHGRARAALERAAGMVGDRPARGWLEARAEALQ